MSALLAFYPFASRADYAAKMGVPCPDWDQSQPVMNWVDPAAIGGTYTGPNQILNFNGVDYIIYPSVNPTLMPKSIIVPVKLAGVGNMLPDHYVGGAHMPQGTGSVYRPLLPNEILVPSPTPFMGQVVVQRTDFQNPNPVVAGSIDLSAVLAAQQQAYQLLLQIALKVGA